MNYTLPQYFILKRYRPNISDNFPELDVYKNIAALISVKKISSNLWSLSLVEYPEIILEGIELIESNNDNWFNNTTPVFSVYSNNSVNNVTMKFNNYVLKCDSGYIPLFKMSEPCYTLSDKFFKLKDDIYKSFRFELKIKYSPKNKHSNSYIQELISNNEVCPVTFVPLTRSSIRITSCGHAISNEVEKWIVDKKTCPICRAPQTLDKLTKWLYT